MNLADFVAAVGDNANLLTEYPRRQKSIVVE